MQIQWVTFKRNTRGGAFGFFRDDPKDLPSLNVVPTVGSWKLEVSKNLVILWRSWTFIGKCPGQLEGIISSNNISTHFGYSISQICIYIYMYRYETEMHFGPINVRIFQPLLCNNLRNHNFHHQGTFQNTWLCHHISTQKTPPYRILIWDPHMGSAYRIMIWDDHTGPSSSSSSSSSAAAAAAAAASSPLCTPTIPNSPNLQRAWCKKQPL